jgi:hypothetical protein
MRVAGWQGRDLGVSSSRRIVPWLIGAALAVPAPCVQAQSNLDAGKSAAQIFADTCSACHRSPRELRPTNAAFLRQHYTTGSQEATIIAAYLAAVGSDPRAVQQRRAPGSGGGQPTPAQSAARGAAPPAAEHGRRPETQAALPATAPDRREASPEQAQSSPGAGASVKPRRPAESVELGKLPSDAAPAAAAEAAPPHAAAAPTVHQEFEE